MTFIPYHLATGYSDIIFSDAIFEWCQELIIRLESGGFQPPNDRCCKTGLVLIMKVVAADEPTMIRYSVLTTFQVV